LLGLVGLLAAGLIVTDVVTYTQVQSFMVARIDPQLRVASYALTRTLESTNGLIKYKGVGAAGPVSGSVTFNGPAAGQVGSRAGDGQIRVSDLAPTGTFAELVNLSGKRFGHPLQSIYGTKGPPPPSLPDPLPPVTSAAIFSSTSAAPNAIQYRVLLQRDRLDQQLIAVVAIPLTEVDQTLGRLLLVEVLVSLVALAGLGLLGLWVVRRGLRPLEDMAGTAGAIAGGDLSQRVSPAENRTEVGRLGIALNAMLGEIELAFAARAASEDRLRRFLADASHELRTPLTSIRGYAEIFDLGADRNPDDLALSMHHIRDEAKRMGVLVEDLFLLARLDHERPLSLRTADVVEIVTKSITAARVAAGSHELLIDAPGAMPVDCDPERVRQVVDNLVVNALRHSPDGAPVRVGVRAVAGMVEISVTDQGPGIPAEDAQRVFEPFFRSDASRARSTGGAGLGLAIVAAIIQAHRGSVGVRDNPGGGACVWIRVPGPVRVDSAPAASSHRAASAASQPAVVADRSAAGSGAGERPDRPRSTQPV
jgi:two-component system OmpR family sensor kinase